MQSRSRQNSRNNSFLRGVSVVEFIGCMAALGGGVALGSIYMGVDVKAVAVEVLQRADIEVPTILSDSAAADEELSTVETIAEDSPGTVAEELVLESPSPLPATEPPVATLESDETLVASNEPDQPTAAQPQLTPEDFWRALDQSVRDEVENRTKSINDPGSWQLYDFLLHRKQGHQKVVELVEQLNQEGIDQRLRAHAEQVLSWHRSGAELFERAAQLLTNGPAGKLSGPFAQSWQSAATQHRMEEKLILDKHAVVASYLEHTYKFSAASPSSN